MSSPQPQEEYYNLGSYHRPITTKHPRAQTWFDRGLIWSYAFNHEESVECFERAIADDPDCTMAYWGLAYSLGPNYNKPWEFFDDQERLTVVERAHRATAQAKEKAINVTPVEQELSNALQFRYPKGPSSQSYSVWNVDYANAMRDVYGKFPHDLDVAALFADALMNLTPWALWDIRTGKPAEGAHTLEVKDVLDKALALEGGLEHPGLLHLYIHFMEMSKSPESALTIADKLRGLVPDAGHLQHMPSHLDILCGDYRRAVASNSDAILADERYLKPLGPKGVIRFYTLYRSHNYHFRIYAAMFSGQSKIALNTVTELENSIPEELLRIQSPPMADWLEGFLAMRVHALIRFGKWQDILKLKYPNDTELYCVTTAMITYARGIAFAATGRVEEAEKEVRLFQDAVKRVPESRTIFNNTCKDILAIAEAMLLAELEYRRGKFDEAFAQFQRSIHLDDSLPYDEPWGWMQPTRHAYGALLLEQGRVKEAEKAYSADLGLDGTLPRALQHPNNVWSLHGYHECLVKLGRESEARIIGSQLKLALAVADVPVKSSCFCRVNDGVIATDCCKDKSH